MKQDLVERILGKIKIFVQDFVTIKTSVLEVSDAKQCVMGSQ